MGAIFQNTSVKPRYIPKNIKHEESLQKEVCNYLRKYYSHVDFHSDYAAGMKLTKNQAIVRSSLQSGRGWSDIFIPYPSRGYHGLFLELKKEGTTIYVTRGPQKGQLSADQQIRIEAAFLDRMNKLKYFARFAVGIENTKQLIDWYFERPDNGQLF